MLLGRRTIMSTDHAKFMALAIEEARKGMRAGGEPFGAVVVREDDIIAQVHNASKSAWDPTGHSEVMSIRAATANLKTLSLKGCTLYTSCEPCPMCVGAMLFSQVDRVVIGARSQALLRLRGQRPRSYTPEELINQMNMKLEVVRGVRQDEAEKALGEYKWPKS